MIALAAYLVLAQVPVANIRATKHNLSAQGGNTIHAQTESEICVFCHTPHGAYQSKPIWNRNLDYQASALYTLYGSSTLDAIPSRPNGATRLCLSCHDGVLALGAVMNQNAQHNTNIPMANGVTTMPQGNTLLGLDLHNDHPVSIVPDTNDPEIQLPPAGDPILLQEGATPGEFDQRWFAASLDHSIWFHRPVRADVWHLYDFTCHSYTGGRGLTLGHVFTAEGVHMATVAQEVLVRRREPRGA